MKEQKKLTLGMAIFTFIIFVAFGVVILNEKSAPHFIPRIEKKLLTYIDEKYKDEKEDFTISKTKYEKTKYQLKITNKKNKNLYFTIYYDQKNIKDTYKEDYQEGKTLLTTLSKNLEKNLTNTYKQQFKVIIPKTLNKYSSQVRDNLIVKNNLKNLKIYTLETTFNVKWNTNDIGNKLITLNNDLKQQELTPKSYKITITNIKDITQSIKISNLTSQIIEDSTTLSSIISDIINNENSELLKQNNISYKYLN